MTEKKFKILIIDAQAKSVDFLKTHLEGDGYEVAGLTAGAQVQSLCEKEKFDLVLLDMGLTDVDSLLLCKNLKSNEATSDLPVIFITSHREMEEKISALESGAVDFITKPFNMDELRARIRVALRQKFSKDTLKEKTHTLEESSLRDSLTGLFNRRYVKERMYEETSRAGRFGQVVSCIIFDLDQFKEINKSYGYETGDKVLKDVADCIRNVVRAIDIVGRYGGEEFVLILPQTDLAGAFVVAEKIRNVVEEKRFDAGGDTVSVTVSIGVASTQEEEADDLLYYADLALEQAKQSGKNKVVAWKKEK